MPRPKKYDTPEDMKRQVDRYFEDRKTKCEFPTFAGMLKYIGISKRTYYRYINIEDDDPDMPLELRHGYRNVFEDAQLRREDWLENRMVTEPKAANGCMNSLKQPQNGGFKDRIEQDINATLTVNVAGVGGEGAFK
jgi:hypothetical protein